MYKHKAEMTLLRLEILKLIARGCKNKEIADILNMSVSKVKLQKWRLYCYLGVNNVRDAVYIGLRTGFLTDDEVSEEIKLSVFGC